MELKGKLIIIGGAEDKEVDQLENPVESHSILERIVYESKHKEKSVIEIITTASESPKGLGKDYIKAFQKLKVKKTAVLSIEDQAQTADPEIVERLLAADVVFITGGDQLRLTTILGGTPFYETVIRRLKDEPGFIYAGTSAGAAAASESMIQYGESADALLKGEVQTSTGFGFVSDIVFDTHFIKRGRIGRLFQIIATNPKILGVGLEENTGLLIQGNKMEAIGPGMTVIVD